MQLQQFSTYTIYVTIRGKLLELHFDVPLFSNTIQQRGKGKKENYDPDWSHSFFSSTLYDLLPAIGEQCYIAMQFGQTFCSGKIVRNTFQCNVVSNGGVTAIECIQISCYQDLRAQLMQLQQGRDKRRGFLTISEYLLKKVLSLEEHGT